MRSCSRLYSLAPALLFGRARELPASRVSVPAGYNIVWSGEYEEYERTRQRLEWVAPLTLLLVCGLIFSNTRSAVQTGIVMLAVPFSCIGAVWILYLAGYHLSLPVWVGLIALAGVDAQTGVFMLLYLDLAWTAAGRCGRLRDSRDVVSDGAGCLPGAVCHIWKSRGRRERTSAATPDFHLVS